LSKRGSFGERLRQMTLAQWGILCVLGGLASGALRSSQPPANRAEAAGRATAVLIFVAIGVVLIVLHFVRGGGRAKPAARKDSRGPGKARKTRRR
jgi:hypothetical protein